MKKNTLQDRITQILALPPELHPRLRLRAMMPHTSEDTRPFELTITKPHIYIARRVMKNRDGEKYRTREVFGRPDEVLAALDAIYPPLPPPPPPPPPPTVKSERWAYALLTLALLIGMCTILATRPKAKANIAALTRLLAAGALVKVDPVVVKATVEVRSNEMAPKTAGIELGQMGAKMGSDRFDQMAKMQTTVDLEDYLADMKSRDSRHMRYGRLRPFFDALDRIALAKSRPVHVDDGVPLQTGQILRGGLKTAFALAENKPEFLPPVFRFVLEHSGSSKEMAALKEALIEEVAAVAFGDDQYGEYQFAGGRLVILPRDTSGRLAAAFRGAYAMPATRNHWVDTDNSWQLTVNDDSVTISEGSL